MEVFVYGTLSDPEQVRQVVDDFEFRGDAVLDGMHRVDGEYPTLAPGGAVEGRILETPDVEALDEYEGVARGLYVRIQIDRAGSWEWVDDSETIDTYVGAPTALGVDEPVNWPGAGSFEERVQAVAADCEIRRLE